MTHSKSLKKIRILFIVFLLFAAFFALYLSKRNPYHWDATVQDYISAFQCDLICLDSYKDDSSDRIIYEFQTDDDLQIVFEVCCFWGNTLSPFGFEVPLKKAKVVDDFAERLCSYISETHGTFNIDDKSIDEISAYVIETLQRCEDLLQEYGMENVAPSVSFTFIKGTETYDFKYGNNNQTILYDKLTELLYQ